MRPDIVHLSNSMLVGMAREIRRKLNVPIVCTLSGEDIFLEKLSAPWYQQARHALRERVQDVTAFVALNRYYADFMVDYAGIDREQIHVIPHGLKLAGHGTRESLDEQPDFRSVILPAFARIRGCTTWSTRLCCWLRIRGLPPCRCAPADTWARPINRIWSNCEEAARGLRDRFEYVGELDRAGKDRISPISRHDERADRLPRKQRAVDPRGLGQRRCRWSCRHMAPSPS